jgi:hypothetical protein
MRNQTNSAVLKDKLLKDYNAGLTFFLKRHPELWLQIRYGASVQIDSPFNPGVSTISIFQNEEKKKWFFKDQIDGGHFGDMFSYVGFLYNLHYAKDFRRIAGLIQQEMIGYEPPIFDTYKLKNNQTGEWIEFLINDQGAGHTFLRSHFYITSEVQFKCVAIEGFGAKVNNTLVEKRSGVKEQLFAIQGVKNKFYYILSSKDFDVREWGLQPNNYYLGLTYALQLNFSERPIDKNNLLLCDKVLDVISFLLLGIPAIKVDPKKYLLDTYFLEIVKPTFSNLILTFDFGDFTKIPSQKQTVKTFDLKKYLKEAGWEDDLMGYCSACYKDHNFLEPLWNLYEHIDDDALIEDDPSSTFSIIP